MKSALLCLIALPALWQPAITRSQTIPVADNFNRLISQEDTDRDQRITVHDRVTPFDLNTDNAVARRLTNVFELSVALQELKRAEDHHRTEIDLVDLKLDENAVDRTHRLIHDFYWDALTRRVDAEHLDEIIHDTKVQSKYDYVYVPGSDEAAVKYFRSLERAAAERQRSPTLKVIVLPPRGRLTGAFVRNLDGAHGILSLKLQLDTDGSPIRGVPYVVPGGRFNELYYWDSYFIVLGLLEDGRKDLARGMADNLFYELAHYGKIPNANRTYYLTRSQPPFLTSVIRAVYEAGAADRHWLAEALKLAMAEYRDVWLGNERLVRVGSHRLSRYFDSGEGPCPEVEAGHYDQKIAPWLELAKKRSGNDQLGAFRFLNEYSYGGQYRGLKVDGLTLDAFFKSDRAVRESGHDTTHRFDDRTVDFVSVDLNSLLFKYEMDFAELLDGEFGGRLPRMSGDPGRSSYWRHQAAARRRAIIDLMWDEQRGFFFDYDVAHRKRSTYLSATGLYPLWARVLDPADPQDQKRVGRIVACAREKLEQPAGLAASARESAASARSRDARQWDYPYGWPPHQLLAWQGLKNYGLDADAERLAYRWLYTIARNAHDYNGTVPEKFDVVTGSHDVFVEYGNVGTKFSYIAPEGFGWMNASFQVGAKYLSPERLADLKRLKPWPQN